MCGGGGQEQEEPLRRIRINKNNAADRNNLIIMRKNKNKNKKQEHPRGRHVAQVAQQIAAVLGPCRLSSIPGCGILHLDQATRPFIV